LSQSNCDSYFILEMVYSDWAYHDISQQTTASQFCLTALLNELMLGCNAKRLHA